MLVLVLGPEEAEDAVKGFETVGVPVLGPTLATKWTPRSKL